MTEFEKQVESQIREIRKELASCENETDFIFTIQASGRVSTGDVSLSYKLERTYDSQADVKGGDLIAVIDEFVRRHSWSKRYAPKCLSAPQPEEEPV